MTSSCLNNLVEELHLRMKFANRILDQAVFIANLIERDKDESTQSGYDESVKNAKATLIDMKSIRSDEYWLSESMNDSNYGVALRSFSRGIRGYFNNLREMKHGVDIWGIDNWDYNRKYVKKFRSAAASLRSFRFHAYSIEHSVSYERARSDLFDLQYPKASAPDNENGIPCESNDATAQEWITFKASDVSLRKDRSTLYRDANNPSKTAIRKTDRPGEFQIRKEHVAEYLNAMESGHRR